MQIASNGDSLHEISNSVYGKNKKNIADLPSAELALRRVKVNIHDSEGILKVWPFPIPCLAWVFRKTGKGSIVHLEACLTMTLPIHIFYKYQNIYLFIY